jgi:hypothetical protein
MLSTADLAFDFSVEDKSVFQDGVLRQPIDALIQQRIVMLRWHLDLNLHGSKLAPQDGQFNDRKCG